MSQLTLLIISFILFLISYPLISIGTTGDTDAVWYIGLAALALAGIIPPVSRFVADDNDEVEEKETE
jgi:hypothetical protein